MRSTNVAENSRKWDYRLNFWSPVRQIDVYENDCNRTIKALLTDHVISRMRRNSYVFNTGPCIIFADNFNYFNRRATEVAQWKGKPGMGIPKM